MSFEKIMIQAKETREEVAELCSNLVKFNSAHPKARTDECVAYIKKYLDKHGIENEIHSINPLKPNIVAKIKGTTNRKILWIGHLDVVPEARATDKQPEPADSGNTPPATASSPTSDTDLDMTPTTARA